MTDDLRSEPDLPEIDGAEAADPAGAAIEQNSNEASAVNAESEDAEEQQADDAESPSKLERLQKILAQAGIASRRHAEELITQGRVQVNGTVVNALGAKADSRRDHIRVDGKLLQGAERIRYFLLNKPKGFVTTVSDPEGRPTVMQFFEKMRERLYPVGRLDYLSEGLLLVTNDGELANKLTRAASGIEKTYLVKVSGRPSEEELDRLREGVAIDRGKPGSGQVHTAPARIRQVRQGDNPWYEVVLIEGRNRELRKMFEEIGHFVEKIRRVGYGPLVLDLEPGKMRELSLEEIEELRKAAEGKTFQRVAKDKLRRKEMESQLPTVGPRRVGGERGFKKPDAGGDREFRPRERFGPPRPAGGTGERGRGGDRRSDARPARYGAGGARPDRGGWKKEERGETPARRPPAGGRFGDRGPNREQGRTQIGTDRSRGERTQDSRPRRAEAGSDRRGPEERRRPGPGRDFGAKPAWKRTENRPYGDRPAARDRGEFGSSRPQRARPESASTGGPRGDRADRRDDRPRSAAPRTERASSGYRREGDSSSRRRNDERETRGSKPAQKGAWKPRTNSGAPSRAETGERPKRSFGSASGPRTGGGFSRPGSSGGRAAGGPRGDSRRGPSQRSGGARNGGGPKRGGTRPGAKRSGGPKRKDRG
jgi:23S rRNA pseudouridine2605 synthase